MSSTKRKELAAMKRTIPEFTEEELIAADKEYAARPADEHKLISDQQRMLRILQREPM